MKAKRIDGTHTTCSVEEAAALIAENIMAIYDISDFGGSEREDLASETVTIMLKKVRANPHRYDMTVEQMRDKTLTDAWMKFFGLVPAEAFNFYFGWTSITKITPVAAKRICKAKMDRGEERRLLIDCLKHFPLSMYFIPVGRHDAYLCSLAVTGNPHAIRFVHPSLITPELMILAVNGDGMVLEYIVEKKKPPIEVAVAAVRNCVAAIKFVPDDTICLDLVQAALSTGDHGMDILTPSALYKRDVVYDRILKKERNHIECLVKPTLDARADALIDHPLIRPVEVPYKQNHRINTGLDAVLESGLSPLEVWDDGRYKLIVPDNRPVFSKEAETDKTAVTGFDLYKFHYAYPLFTHPKECYGKETEQPAMQMCFSMCYGAPLKLWLDIIQAFYSPFNISSLYVEEERERDALDSIAFLADTWHKAGEDRHVISMATSYNTELKTHERDIIGSPFFWFCREMTPRKEAEEKGMRIRYEIRAIFRLPGRRSVYLDVTGRISAHADVLSDIRVDTNPVNSEHVKQVIACALLQRAMLTHTPFFKCSNCSNEGISKTWWANQLLQLLDASDTGIDVCASELTELRFKEERETGKPLAPKYITLRTDLFAKHKDAKYKRTGICLIMAAMLTLQLCGESGYEQVKILETVYDYYTAFMDNDDMPLPWDIE